MLIRCQNCGSLNEEDKEHCTRCGAHLPKRRATPQSIGPIEEGRCVVESLARMLDRPADDIRSWFKDTGKNPSHFDDIKSVLINQGYSIEFHDKDGFGEFAGSRRLVGLARKRDPTEGHVILVYEKDANVFDPDNCYATVEKLSAGLAVTWNIEWVAILGNPASADSQPTNP